MADMPDDGPSVASSSLSERVTALMPQLEEELARLVAIPSVSAAGFPEPRRPLLDAYDFVVGLLRDAGVEVLEPLELPDTAPVIMGEIPAPDGAPTVLLYGHYDVVPAGDESKWESPPFEATERDGAVYGRGAADSKSNILVHVGALRAWGGKPPVGIKLVIEGQEEIGSALTTFPPSQPELFAADAMVIADMGSLRPGVPTLTVGLRGMAGVIVQVRTLAGPKHSGQFGGAAPDALLVLLHALATLHDENGDVAVPGLRREEWTGASYSDDEFRDLAEIVPGMPFFGTGGLGERIWSGPAITVTGIDAPDVANASNTLLPGIRVRVSARIAPGQDAKEAFAAIRAHLEANAPFGARLAFEDVDTGQPFLVDTSGWAVAETRAAMAEAWGREPVEIGVGGSIPFIAELVEEFPGAQILVTGVEDPDSRAHSPNESLHLGVFKRALLAEALFLARLEARGDAS